jgi:hypothetical protein
MHFNPRPFISTEENLWRVDGLRRFRTGCRAPVESVSAATGNRYHGDSRLRNSDAATVGR